ncbi:MAG: hypothetical protein J3Q66DRAFT_445902 [Benniella sp.]|nr:MAG: hypothetical protein J3Q66DRAFT_445902 [Benniella sp.]
MPPESPLHIPEIMSMIVSYLEGNDLARCLRVSKIWRDIFLPHRWRAIERRVDLFGYYGPNEGALHKYQHLVQDLVVYGASRAYLHHPNLRKLHMIVNLDIGKDRIGIGRTIHWGLTEKYPLLDYLSLSSVNVDRLLCREILEHPSIRTLSLGSAVITEDILTDFWEACRNLECLIISAVNFKSESTLMSKDTVFGRMRRLVLGYVKAQSLLEQLDPVFHCPMLEKLEWEPPNALNVWMNINHPVQRDNWPQLNELRISIDPQDSELGSLLEGLGNCFGKITNLRAWRGTFGPQASKALGFHFTTLVELRLNYRMSVASSTIRDVLCSCPNLEILRTRIIYARDIAEGGPWVCQQLRELGVCFRVGETEQGLHSLVFERLSTLTRLETLDMKESARVNHSSDGVLDFRLDYGLERLASLHELRVLRFHTKVEHMQQIGTKEVEWMTNNWKKLKGIYGRLNRDPEVESQLSDALKSPSLIALTSTTSFHRHNNHREPVSSVLESHAIREPTTHTGTRGNGCLLSGCRRSRTLPSRLHDLARYLPLPQVACHRKEGQLVRVFRTQWRCPSQTPTLGAGAYNVRRIQKVPALPNLRMLCIKFHNHEDETYYHHFKEDMDWDLTKLYSVLDRLVLTQIHVEPPMCRTISKHPSIRNIFLYDSKIDEYNLAVFWEACRNLECLEMTRISFKGGSMSVPKDAVFNRLRKLAIKSTRKMSPSEQLDLVFHCPKLETLEWDPPGAISTRIMINHPIQKDRWPQLDELHILGYPQDTMCASVLEGIRGCFGKIVELELLNSTFGPQASKAFGFHSSTLVKLYLNLDSVASSTIQDVLCSCPKLEILWARAIDAKDIAEGAIADLRSARHHDE